MAPFILKFKGNKSFVAFHNMSDGDSLTKTWKVCTKVAAHLEQGQRLENLSWRLWHLHNIMVETDNAKSKRDFKKLSRTMGDKLDREKGKNIEELRAPGYKRTESSDKMRRRAEEIERLRDESHSGGGMRRMQFTFSLDTPSPSGTNSQKAKITVSAHPEKPAPMIMEPVFKVEPPKPERKTIDNKTIDKTTTSTHSKTPNAEKGQASIIDRITAPPTASLPLLPLPTPSVSAPNPTDQLLQALQSSVLLPGIFSSHFGPTALLHPSPSFAPSLSYGEDIPMSYPASGISPSGGMGVSRPTIELPLDELLEVDGDTSDTWGEVLAGIETSQNNEDRSKDQSGRPAPAENNIVGQNDEDKLFDLDFEIAQIIQAEGARIAAASVQSSLQQQTYNGPASPYSKQTSGQPRQRPAQTTTLNPMALYHILPPATVNNGPGSVNPNSNTTSGRGTPGATAVPTTAPVGQKTECSNCGATHTPLWRRGLNDELNCNACGLYCKLHKRPRPKSMRASHGDNPRNGNSHSRSIDSDTIGAKCFNCHTTATPLWRKDDEGKTVCNACGLYYKLHGTNRPLSMKSDVIRKRSRHEIRRDGLPGSSSETPSASPGASRRASPARATSPPPVPEEENREEEPKTPQFSYDYTANSSQTDHATKKSPPNDMLSAVSSQDKNDSASEPNASSSGYFPGPYHPDYLYQIMTAEPPPIQTGDNSGYSVEDRGNKRRRLSSASYDSSSTPIDPPPSATSLNSGRSKSPSSSTFGLPYSMYNYPGISDAASAWATGRIHPPMVLPEDAPMEFLHPPMVLPGSHSSSSMSSYPYLHPPMLPVEEAALSYMRPPMQAQANSPIVGYMHPPMLPSYWNNEQNSTFTENTANSNDNSHSTDMFDSMMN